MLGQGSGDSHRAQERYGCGDSRSADTVPTAPSSPDDRRVLAELPALVAQRRSRHYTQLAADGPARSPVFCGDLLHDLDLEITLDYQLLQSRVDRPLAELMPLDHDRYRLAIGLADDRDHLLFRETRFVHCSLQIGSQSLT